MGAFFSAKTEVVRLWLDAKAAWFAGQTPWHPSQKLESRPGGSAVMTLEVSGTQDIVRKIMEWCPDVLVMEPPSLLHEVEQRLRIGQQRHRDRSFEDINPQKPKRDMPNQSIRRKIFAKSETKAARSEPPRRGIKSVRRRLPENGPLSH
jgi:hypothetical protein